MTKRDFFNILIKLFGLYSIVKLLFTYFPSTLSFLIHTPDWTSIIGLLAALLLIVSLNVLLIFKSKTIIKWLKLDKNFDDDRLSVSDMDVDKLLTLGLIIIGGLLFINNIGAIISQILGAVQMSARQMHNNNEIFSLFSNLNIIAQIINVVIGYFLVVYSHKIAIRVGQINQMNGKDKA